MMFANRAVGQTVSPPDDAFKRPDTNEAAERLRVNARFGNFAPRYRAEATGDAQHTRRRTPIVHVAKCRHLVLTVNVLPLYLPRL